ncbi:MAG TPA: hypothetical protein VEN79_00600, partial [Terriglobia bacterium]|nr:hypothetical protein [Terriglobia bacterium]
MKWRSEVRSPKPASGARKANFEILPGDNRDSSFGRLTSDLARGALVWDISYIALKLAATSRVPH